MPPTRPPPLPSTGPQVHSALLQRNDRSSRGAPSPRLRSGTHGMPAQRLANLRVLPSWWTREA
eukprot:6305025-Lingulodinium_polyedra.AAC.1